jgi:hypothetical protein
MVSFLCNICGAHNEVAQLAAEPGPAYMRANCTMVIFLESVSY